MAQGRYFINPAEHIAQYTYQVKVPAYVLHQPEEYRSGEMTPIFAPAYPDTECKARMTINRLLNLFSSKTPFVICRDIDQVEILHQIDRYLVSMEDRVRFNDPAVIDYVARLGEFRKVWYRKCFLRALNRNPHWKACYRGEQGELIEILKLFAGPLGGPKSLDPIEALAEPPYPLPALSRVESPEVTSGSKDYAQSYIDANPEPYNGNSYRGGGYSVGGVGG